MTTPPPDIECVVAVGERFVYDDGVSGLQYTNLIALAKRYSRADAIDVAQEVHGLRPMAEVYALAVVHGCVPRREL